MSIDKLEPFLGMTDRSPSIQTNLSFEIFKYLINQKRTLFMDDREIHMWYLDIWTEIDLEANM